MAADSCKIPSSVASWAATPAPFSIRKHGTRVKFSENNSVAERMCSDVVRGNAVVYTADHLPLEQVWQTTIRSITGSYYDGMVSIEC